MGDFTLQDSVNSLNDRIPKLVGFNFNPSRMRIEKVHLSGAVGDHSAPLNEGNSWASLRMIYYYLVEDVRLDFSRANVQGQHVISLDLGRHYYTDSSINQSAVR